MASLYKGFIFPNISDPYVYLKTLNTDHNIIANRVGNVASGILSNINSSIEQEHINKGLLFLGQVAASQRGHEMAFLREQMRLIAASGNGEIQKEILQELESVSNAETFDYIKFIQVLNNAMQGIEKYKQRLAGLKHKRSNKTDGQRNLINSLQTTIGDFTGRREQFNYGQEELIRQLTIQFFNTSVGQNFIANQIGKNGAINFATAAAIVQSQLAQYVYDKMLLEYTTKYYKDEQEFLKELDRLSKQLDDFIKQSNIDKTLSNQTLLDEAAKLYGLQIALEERIPRRNKEMRETQQKMQNIRAQVGDPLKGRKRAFTDALKKIRVEWKGSSKLGLAAELQSLISSRLNGTHMGSFNTGTDVLLGQFIATIPTTNNNDPTLEAINKIKFNIEDQQAANDINKMSDIYINQLTTLENRLAGLGKGFILHETTKFYQSVEKGEWFRGKKGFHGRHMALLNYIDAISQFGGSFGIDSNWLKFAAYNLSDSALGSALKAPLETYFAIAAGLIMFDDFSIIAKEVTERLTFSNASAIHLYNLQGVYVPASYFLQQTYNVMTQVGEELIEGNGFKATITTPSISYSRSMAPTMAERWEIVKQEGSKVYIDLVFAANFLNLVSQLF